MADKIETIIVKGTVGIVGMTGACSGNSSANVKAGRTAGQAWGQTVLWMNSRKALDTFDRNKEVKDIAEDLRKEYKLNFLIDWDDAVTEGDKEELTPELQGKNYRTGKMVPILDSNGEPKWSSWDETKLSIQYLGDIAHVVKAGMTKELIVDEKRKKVVGKNSILKLAKGQEDPLKTIQRSCDMVEKKATAVKDADLASALAAAQAALKAIQDVMDAKAGTKEQPKAESVTGDTEVAEALPATGTDGVPF